MGQHPVRQSVRRPTLDAQPARRKECAEQERRLEPSAVAALTALGERDAAVRETERRACGAVDSDLRRALVGSRGGRVVRQRRHTAG